MGFTVKKGSEKGSQKGFWEGGFQKVPRMPPCRVRPFGVHPKSIVTLCICACTELGSGRRFYHGEGPQCMTNGSSPRSQANPQTFPGGACLLLFFVVVL